MGFILAVPIFWGIGAVTSGVGAATPPSSVLTPPDALSASMSLTSTNGQFLLTMQSGGDLVETTKAGATVWSSGTSSAGSFAVMQADGNFVVYSASSIALWSTGTWGNPGAFLSLGNLGQLSVNNGSGVPLWEPGIVPPGTTVTSGSSKVLPGGQYQLTMQAGGALVETNSSGTTLWSSGTTSVGAYAVMQTDGNLVVYSSTSTPLWATNTNGNAGAHLTIGGLGQLAIVTTSGTALWEPGTLPPGTGLASGASTVTPGGKYRLTMQTGGALVETNSAGATLWSSGTTSAGAHALMQTDGNLVVYSTTSAVLWASATNGNPGAALTINSHGQLVINSASGVPLWGPGVVLGTSPGVFAPGSQLVAGQSFLSAALPTGEQFQLIMQSDGNLVEYPFDGSSVWHSATKSPGAHAIMQTDGNLVVYSTTSAVLWASSTAGNPGASLTIADIGQIAVRSTTAVSLWASTIGRPGVPMAPTSVSAVAGNGSVPDAAALVSWAPVQNVWSAPIWGYTVTSKPGAKTGFVSGPATSGTVPGLTDGVAYTFTVTATNGVGTSGASWPASNAAIPRAKPVAPGPPAGIEAVPGNTDATVSWHAPIDTGGSPVTGFVVTASPGGAQVLAGPTATSAVLSGLTNGTTYTVTVSATNAQGTGAASQPSAPFVPATTPFPAGSTLTPDMNASDWPMYNYSTSASNWNAAETKISPTTAATLSVGASASGLGQVQSSIPTAAFGHVFVGSNTGYETALSPTSLARQWSTFLGVDNPNPICPAGSPPFGPVSAPTSATVNGTTNVVYLAGGDDAIYALNASTGGILWRTTLGPLPDNFSFVSPLLYNGALYIGIASYGDCPIVQGKFFKIDPFTGAIDATFNIAPNGCIGGGLWGSPSVDSSGHIFFATGTDVPGCKGTTEGVTGDLLETSVVEVDANLNLVGYWHLPLVDQTADSDFGSVPTIFNVPGVGSGHLVAVANKNGIVYALDRQNLSAGPIWQTSIAVGGGDPGSQGSISPMAYDGTSLYAAGAQTTIAGKSCGAGLRALNPTTGAVKWAICFAAGPAIGPVTGANGVVVFAEHTAVVAVNAATGSQLASVAFPNGLLTWSGASVSNGNIFAENAGGQVIRLAP